VVLKEKEREREQRCQLRRKISFGGFKSADQLSLSVGVCLPVCPSQNPKREDDDDDER
jgi:hypothetical protein